MKQKDETLNSMLKRYSRMGEISGLEVYNHVHKLIRRIIMRVAENICIFIIIL